MAKTPYAIKNFMINFEKKKKLSNLTTDRKPISLIYKELI